MFLLKCQFRMQIQGFKVFRDLVETASFSQAAALNSITQSAVSQQIRGLERHFKAVLIERGKKNFSLTPEGRAFLDASQEILGIYDGLGSRIHELQNVIAGPLKIATVYSIGLHELPPYLKRYRVLYPDVDVQVDYRRASQVYNDILSGLADFGLVAFPVRRKGIIVESFWRDKLVLICPPSHSLASRKSVRFRDLAGEKFISFEPDQPTTKAINHRLNDAAVQVRRVMEFDNIETVKRAVEIENGISVVPLATVSQEVASHHLVAIEFNETDMFRPIGVISKRNRAISPPHKRFLELLKNDSPGLAPFGEAVSMGLSDLKQPVAPRENAANGCAGRTAGAKKPAKSSTPILRTRATNKPKTY